MKHAVPERIPAAPSAGWTARLGGHGLGAVLLWAFAILASMQAATAAESQPVEAPHIAALLVTENEQVIPGQPFVAALVLRPEADWHTYWRNPGDTGLPTRISWQLPGDSHAGEILWPAPERIAFGDLTNFGYHGETVLPVTITPAAGLVPGDRFELVAVARWLVCKDVCIPGKADLGLTLPVVAGGAQTVAGAWSERLLEAVTRAPQPLPAKEARFYLSGDMLVMAADLRAPRALSTARTLRFFPATADLLTNGAEPEMAVADATLYVRAPRSADGGQTPPRLEGVVVVEPRAGPPQQFAVVAQETSEPIRFPEVKRVAAGPTRLPLMLLLGFLGGVVLNLMPCVFPVLSLKVLKLVESGQRAASERRLQGVAYTAGTTTTFVLVAAAMLFLRAAGEEIGWGFQLQSPSFVAAMAYLLFLMGLSLSGFVDIGAGLTRAGNMIGDDAKLTGSFMTGVLATIVATPCTAPFMGTAMGFAMTQPAAVALSVFVALGLGLAAPFLAVAFAPGLARAFPKPGAWMETLKQFLAFPLYLTTVWLLWVLARQTDSGVLAEVMVGLVLIGFAVWLARVTRLVRRRPLPVLAVTASALLAIALLPRPGADAADDAAASYAAVAYSEASLETALAQGRPVFVNFTADWCITCKVNERVAINRRAVVEEFTRRDVLYLKGDWTNSDPRITRVLERFGRNGVPLYLVYRPGRSAPRVLPQILTADLIVDALKSS